MSTPPLLSLTNVSRYYPGLGAGGAAGAVLEGIDLDVAAGEALAITGPSGCGKSTLLNLIGALDRPDEGQILFDNRNYAQLDDKELARLRNREIGFVFQEHHLLPQCTVLENVLVPTIVPGAPRRGAKARERAESLLERVGLAARLNHRPAQLSGGERQRVAVVRALINSPRLLLADEPTGSLDEAAASAMGEMLRELNRSEQVALIVVTHARELAATMPRRLVLRQGRLESAERSRR